jgi:hypothetical protein
MIDLSKLITAEQKQVAAAQAALTALTTAMQAHLDDSARTRGYDGILSLCSYAASAHPKFAAEARAGVAWRDAVWAKGYEIQAAVLAGTRPMPTIAEVMAELPALEWPA